MHPLMVNYAFSIDNDNKHFINILNGPYYLFNKAYYKDLNINLYQKILFFLSIPMDTETT